MAMKLTRHFTHEGREADLEIEQSGLGVTLRVKTIESRPAIEMKHFWEGSDVHGKEREVEVVTEWIPMGKMVEVFFSDSEWAQFISAAEIFGSR